MDEQNGTSRQELIAVIREVRNRWRLKLLLRGGLIVIVGALLAIVLASIGLQSYKFSPSSVTTLRVAVFGAFALLLGLWLVLPMRRRVNDMQVALYVEEHEPSLQAAILSAVDVSGPVGPDQTPVPPAIVEKMVAQAIEKARTIEGGKAIGRQTLRRLAVAVTSAAAIVALLLSIGPEFLRQGASALLVLSTSASAASPYAITVEPGDVNVPKGSDQTIKARLAGFRTNEVMLMVKEAGSDKIDRRPLVVTGDAAIFEGMLFDLKGSIEYYVEADGVKSPSYKMSVVELPAVSNLEIEYIYPAYTGLAPQKLAVGGDVAALRGTEVRVKITSTMATPGGRLLFDPGNPAGLTTQADGTLTGSFTIGEDGYYNVELTGPRGEKVTASPKYTIDAIEDQPPTVAIEKPRRDIQANPVEEVYIKAKADDDYGVRQLDLVYSVNGGAEKTVTLYGKGAKPLTEVSGAQTIYLEELGVKAGDFVSYYAIARDTDTVKGPKSTSSDIYFVQIRPFGQNFREAQSQAGGGGGGGGGGRGNQPGALSEQQRQVISATFNVNRDKAKNPPDKVKEDTKFVELSQEKLRSEVETLVQTMRQRLGAGAGENIQRIVDLLPKAAEEMKAAEAMLRDQKTKEALAPEQRALKHLQDAEQAYELEVRRQQQGGGGGGGGGGGQMASELADLFQLQLDRQANQYEQQQRAQQQSADQEIDELAERLRELARRQLQQAEQQRRQRGQQQQSQGGGSGQRSLADEAEQMARQLEQLRRESERQGQQRPDLADAAKRLQESANAMRQAAASGQDGGAAAQQAYQRLQEAAKQLESNQAQQSGQNVRDLQRKADDLARQQKDVSQRVAGLDKAGEQKDQQMRQLAQEKDEMRGKVADIEQQLGSLARQALASNQRDSARKLNEAAGSIRDNMLKEKIEYSRSAMSGGAEYTKPIESEIGSNIEQLRQKLGEASTAADAAQQGQGLNRASNNMRDLTRDLNSLGEQMDQALGQRGQQGQGQQGEQGQGEKGGQQGQGEKGQGQGQGEKGQGEKGQGEKGQGQGEKGQGQGQGQGEKGQGQGQGEKGQGQGQGGEKGQGQGGGKGNQRLGEGKGEGKGEGQMTGNPAPQGSRNASGDARPELSQGQVRQWTNQANQLANDAQDVKKQLQQAGVNPRDLTPVDDVIKALRALGDAKSYNDPSKLQDLYSSAVEKFKALEYEVRKKVDTTNEALFLSGSDEVPPKYKDLIQEYYRALSKKASGGKDK